MTEPNEEKVQDTECRWVPATPLDAIQEPPLRCRVKPYGKPYEWAESTLVGYDRTDEFQWAVADPNIQWADVCEVWKPKTHGPTNAELAS